MRNLSVILLVLAVIGCKNDGKSAEEERTADQAKARAVVETAVTALGGQALLQDKLASYSMTSKGTFFGKPYVMTTAWRAPDMMLMDMDEGALSMGYSGKTCWNRFHTIVKDCMKAEQASYPETLWSYHLMTLYPLLDDEMQLKYLGQGRIGEKVVDKIQVNAAGAPMPVTIAFDKETGLPDQFEYDGTFAGMKGHITTDITGWTNIDGTKVMTAGVMSMDGKQMMKDAYVSVDWTPVPAERFVRPPQAETGKPVLRTEPAVVVAVAIHNGPYEEIGRTIGKLYGWLGTNGIQPWGPPTMEYIKNPGNTEKPKDYETKVSIPIMAPAGEKPDSKDIWFEKLEERRIAVQVEQGDPQEVSKAYGDLRKWVEGQHLVLTSFPSMTSFSDPGNTPPEQQLHELFYVVEEHPGSINRQ